MAGECGVRDGCTMSRVDPKRVDLYGGYANFADAVMAAVRRETFGVDIGQNSWITAAEFDRFVSWLRTPLPSTPPAANQPILEIACGSGGPALHMAKTLGCRVTGIDAEERAIATARRGAEAMCASGRCTFMVADANGRLPFEDESFDGIICIDAMNHLPDRPGVMRQWRRVLRPGCRAMFTDPVVITGPVTNDELALRSSIGTFVFVPPGVNERLIEESGLALVQQEDVSENAAMIAERWRNARQKHRDDLVKIEGNERFEGLQRFFQTVHELTSQRRLSRVAYLLQKPGG
jgi:SAM-dependent methyltransferase